VGANREAEDLMVGPGWRASWLIVARGRDDVRAPDRRSAPRHGTMTGRRGGPMSAWFTVRLDDRPGSPARAALASPIAGGQHPGIVGVAEDTDASS